jgi:hypothetical protein
VNVYDDQILFEISYSHSSHDDVRRRVDDVSVIDVYSFVNVEAYSRVVF